MLKMNIFIYLINVHHYMLLFQAITDQQCWEFLHFILVRSMFNICSYTSNDSYDLPQSHSAELVENYSVKLFFACLLFFYYLLVRKPVLPV